MSTSAYRVLGIKHVEGMSFSNHDEKLFDFLGVYECPTLDEDCCGLFSVSTERIEEAIEQASEMGLDESKVNSLRLDIQSAKDKGEDWVEYFLI